MLRIPYGAAVSLISYHGRFAYVQVGALSGFVQKDDLTEDETHIHPACTDGAVYGSDNDVTRCIRRYIADEFSVAYLNEPLQAIEYVWYMWRRSGTALLWPTTRPRLAGTWHEHLRGVRGVSIGVLPKTGAAMEWHTDQGVGMIAYVTTVSPDERVTAVLVGEGVPGQYSVRTYSKSMWRELRPVFITVA
jgi:hypothetical protein